MRRSTNVVIASFMVVLLIVVIMIYLGGGIPREEFAGYKAHHSRHHHPVHHSHHAARHTGHRAEHHTEHHTERRAPHHAPHHSESHGTSKHRWLPHFGHRAEHHTEHHTERRTPHHAFPHFGGHRSLFHHDHRHSGIFHHSLFHHDRHQRGGMFHHERHGEHGGIFHRFAQGLKRLFKPHDKHEHETSGESRRTPLAFFERIVTAPLRLVAAPFHAIENAFDRHDGPSRQPAAPSSSSHNSSRAPAAPSGAGTASRAAPATPAAVTTLGPVGALAGQVDAGGQASDDDPGWWSTMSSWFGGTPLRSTGRYQWLPGRSGSYIAGGHYRPGLHDTLVPKHISH